MIALVNKFESVGLCKDMPPNLKEFLMRVGTGTLDALKEKQVQIEFYDYLDTEGVLEKIPQLRAAREFLSRLPETDAARTAEDEASNPHEDDLLFNAARDELLEKFEGLEGHGEARENVRSCDSWDDFLKLFAPDSPETRLRHLVTNSRSPLVQRGLEALRDSGLLKIPSDAETKAGMQYIKTSPLLTLMLRGHFFWSEDKRFVASYRVALALFYSHRCQRWPPMFPTTRTAAWNAAQSEAEVEFYNLASAAAICKDQLRGTNRGFTVEQMMMDTVHRP